MECPVSTGFFCFSSLPKVDDGTLWPWWLHETIPIINLYLSICVCVCVCVCPHVQLLWLFCDPMDCSSPGSSVHGSLQQEYWSGLPCPPPGDLPDPDQTQVSCTDKQILFHWATWKALSSIYLSLNLSIYVSLIHLSVLLASILWRTLTKTSSHN